MKYRKCLSCLKRLPLTPKYFEKCQKWFFNTCRECRKKEREKKREIEKQKERQTIFYQRYHKFLSSKKWKKLSKELVSKAKKCSICGKKGRNKLIAHHLSYEDSVLLNPENIKVICKTCHGLLHSRVDYKELKPQVSKRARESIGDGKREFLYAKKEILRIHKQINP